MWMERKLRWAGFENSHNLGASGSRFFQSTSGVRVALREGGFMKGFIYIA